MKKHSFSLLAVVLLVTACSRKDAKTEETLTQAETESSFRQCASQEILEKQMAEDPARAAAIQQLEQKTALFKPGMSRFNGTLYIPVVVHVVLPNPNLVTDAQIQSQIDVLNNDYNKANSELSNSNVYLAGYNYNDVANCQITYYVSQTIRKTTSATSFGTNDAVKKSSMGGSDAVNATTMLNLWVCNLSSGYLGYAQFPGGNASTDGVVIDYQAFGTTSTGYSLYAQFNKGRTATHEIGHWLNLRHIWGDFRCGNDYVSDTPPHDDSNGGCPGTGHRSRCSGKPLEQWMNYMDYTDDACMYMFSAGQKVRMDAAIDAARASYVSTTR
jgi:hypothetical protein